MTKEWENRVRMWIDSLSKRLYTPVETMEFSYFTTMEHLTLEEAMERQYLPVGRSSFSRYLSEKKQKKTGGRKRLYP